MLRVHARAESGRYLGSARCPCRTRVAPESHPSRCARCLPKSRAAAPPRRVPSSPSRHCPSAGRGKSLALHHYSQLRWRSLFTCTRGRGPGQVSGPAAEAGPQPMNRHGRRQARCARRSGRPPNPLGRGIVGPGPRRVPGSRACALAAAAAAAWRRDVASESRESKCRVTMRCGTIRLRMI